MKATAIAPSNIAFIKYWGRKDEILRLPTNGSISMNLSNLLTTTTVEFNPSFIEDTVIFGEKEANAADQRVIAHIDRIRKRADIQEKVKVITKNNFPSGSGLSSSASGFAALTVAGVGAAGLTLSEKELSILARLGSGSACRSIPDGFVEWLDGDTSETSYAISLYPPEYWDITDVVALVSSNKKDVSSTEGQRRAASSPFFQTRLVQHPQKMQQIKTYLEEKNFQAFGEVVEAEALELHAIYLTSQPSLLYLLPESLGVMQAVKKWREDGLSVYFSLNTGQDVHIICQKSDTETVVKLVEGLSEVQKTIINNPGKGARIVDKHLF